MSAQFEHCSVWQCLCKRLLLALGLLCIYWLDGCEGIAQVLYLKRLYHSLDVPCQVGKDARRGLGFVCREHMLPDFVVHLCEACIMDKLRFAVASDQHMY